MNCWYSCRPNEIFLDLDSMRAIARGLGVLRCAVLNKQLKVQSVWLFASRQKNHAHLIIELKEPIPVLDRIAWTLWFGSDRLRAAYALARYQRVLGNTELFCAPRVYHRTPDAFCHCKKKHKDRKVTSKCPAMLHLLGDERNADYFARTGRKIPRHKIRVPWGKVSVSQILKWKASDYSMERTKQNVERENVLQRDRIK